MTARCVVHGMTRALPLFLLLPGLALAQPLNAPPVDPAPRPGLAPMPDRRFDAAPRPETGPRLDAAVGTEQAPVRGAAVSDATADPDGRLRGESTRAEPGVSLTLPLGR